MSCTTSWIRLQRWCWAAKRPDVRSPFAVQAGELELKFEIERCFKIQDKDNNNSINETELGPFLRALGLCPTMAEVSETPALAQAHSHNVQFFD